MDHQFLQINSNWTQRKIQLSVKIYIMKRSKSLPVNPLKFLSNFPLWLTASIMSCLWFVWISKHIYIYIYIKQKVRKIRRKNTYLDRGWLSQPTKIRFRRFFFRIAIEREATSCCAKDVTNTKYIRTFSRIRIMSKRLRPCNEWDWVYDQDDFRPFLFPASTYVDLCPNCING